MLGKSAICRGFSVVEHVVWSGIGMVVGLVIRGTFAKQVFSVMEFFFVAEWYRNYQFFDLIKLEALVWYIWTVLPVFGIGNTSTSNPRWLLFAGLDRMNLN